MQRTVALVGAVLTIVGMGLQLLTYPVGLQVTASGPLTGPINVALHFFPALCVVATFAGAIMLVLALLARLTGDQPPGLGHPTLLWAGLAVTLATAVGDYLLRTQATYERMEDVPVVFLHGVFLTLGALQVVAGACIALWLTGRLVHRRPASQEHDASALAPSRPF